MGKLGVEPRGARQTYMITTNPPFPLLFDHIKGGEKNLLLFAQVENIYV